MIINVEAKLRLRLADMMTLTQIEKDEIKRTLADVLSREKEVKRDIAVFQDSDENYLTLAMRYRKDVRPVARRIPVDLIPLKDGVSGDPFLTEIKKGETVYER